MNRTELNVEYDSEMRPVSAACAACGERMAAPPEDVQHSFDIIVWFSGQYIEHRVQKHSRDERRKVPRD